VTPIKVGTSVKSVNLVVVVNSVMFDIVECTISEHFPNLAVAGSIPISRSIFNTLTASP
jgi:hypothetical protein